jgi:hypothetical protein
MVKAILKLGQEESAVKLAASLQEIGKNECLLFES